MELKKAGLIAEFTNNAISGKFGVRMKNGAYWRRVDDDSELLEIARSDEGLFQRLRHDYFTVTVHFLLNTSCIPSFSIYLQDQLGGLMGHFVNIL